MRNLQHGGLIKDGVKEKVMLGDEESMRSDRGKYLWDWKGWVELNLSETDSLRLSEPMKGTIGKKAATERL